MPEVAAAAAESVSPPHVMRQVYAVLEMSKSLPDIVILKPPSADPDAGDSDDCRAASLCGHAASSAARRRNDALQAPERRLASVILTLIPLGCLPLCYSLLISAGGRRGGEGQISTEWGKRGREGKRLRC